MTIIRQQSLFSIEELNEMEPTQKYEEIMDAIDLDAIFYEINRKSHLGAPTQLPPAVPKRGRHFSIAGAPLNVSMPTEEFFPTG